MKEIRLRNEVIVEKANCKIEKKVKINILNWQETKIKK